MKKQLLLKRNEFVSAASLLFLSILPSVGSAHAGLISSEPGRRAVLNMPPKQIRLCFNENIEPDFSKVVLEDVAGKTLVLASPIRDASKASCLVVPLPHLANGGYWVKYKVLSVDGHVVEYGYQFQIKAAGAVND
jgi:methionine-rich copper-binding protein CopC